MKKYTLWLVVLVFLMLNNNNSNKLLAQAQGQIQMQKTVVSGTIKNAKVPVVSVVINPNPLVTSTITYADTLDADGNFSIVFNLAVPIPAKFSYRKSSLPLFIEPGDSLYVTTDATKMAQSIVYNGQPTAAIANRSLIKFQQQFQQAGLNYNNPRKVKELEPNAYYDYVMDIKAQRYEFHKNYVKDKATPSFEAYYIINTEYEAAVALFNYPVQNARRNGKKVNTPVQPDFFKSAMELSLTNETAMLIPAYTNYLDAYVAHRFSYEKMQQTPNYDFDYFYADKYDYASKYLSGRPLYFVQAKSFAEGCIKGRVELVLPRYDDFMKNNIYPEYSEVVKWFKDNMSRLAAGNMAPDFEIEDINGKKMKLSDFKGKVVYLDFWATWCGPCRKEMPFSQKMKEQFEGKDVVFLYVSTDKDAAKWEKMVKEEKFKGTHLIAKEQKQAISKAYNITGIPKFVLIDQEGKIANSKAKRPSDPRAASEINALLNKK